MKTALWIIAVCEAIRVAQNNLQLIMAKKGADARNNAYTEFVKSLKTTDREFVQRRSIRSGLSRVEKTIKRSYMDTYLQRT